MDIRAARSVQAAATSPPTSEQGTMLPDGVSNMNAMPFFQSSLSWADLAQGDNLEHVPDLKWQPNGEGLVKVLHQMRADAQVQGLFLGTTLPIRRYGWFLEPNSAREEVVTALSQDYNIPIRGQEDQPRGRRQGRFNWQVHLRHVLLSLIYGHMYFEQVGDIGSDSLWHLRKLGVRMPQSISKIGVEKDGGLSYLVQRGMGVTAGGRERRLDVSRLLAYVWEQEGANWTGRSLLRGIYKNFLLKDTVLRVGAINIERAGGVPVMIGPKGASPEDLAELAKMARQFRVGANAGGAIPNGAELILAKAAGGDEAINYVKLMNEEMGRGFLMMFMNLGQATTGSYALGSSLIDYVLNTQEVVAQWICDVFTEYMIEDHVTWNWGADEQIPILVYKRTDDRQLAISDLVSLIDKGVITVDDELESWLREDYRMPRRNHSLTPRSLPTVGSPPSGAIQAPGNDAQAMEMFQEIIRSADDGTIERLRYALEAAHA